MKINKFNGKTKEIEEQDKRTNNKNIREIVIIGKTDKNYHGKGACSHQFDQGRAFQGDRFNMLFIVLLKPEVRSIQLFSLFGV